MKDEMGRTCGIHRRNKIYRTYSISVRKPEGKRLFEWLDGDLI